MSNRKNANKLLQENIAKLLQQKSNKSLTLKQILTGLNLQSNEKQILLDAMAKMQKEGQLIKTGSGRYGLPERHDYLTGTLQSNRRGFAFLRPDLQDEDVFISAKNLRDAAHGDRVIVRLNKKKSSNRSREGAVTGVLDRGQRRLVGTLHQDKKRRYVVPDDKRFPDVVEVPVKDVQQARNGDKVVVEIKKWAHGNRPSRGRLVENFGPAGERQTEQQAFKHKFDLPGDFPDAVKKVLDELPGEQDIASLAEKQDREVLDELQMVTIDDEQARDFDDAVSLEMISDGVYRLGVHIADVSEYVREGKPLDREAYKRGTSTYLVDRVIHMLPPQLSENLCSLQAEKNRLAVSAIMDIDQNGELIKARFFPSLIRVTERLTYQQVEAYFNNRQKRDVFKNQNLADMLDRMSGLAEILRRRRFERGALDLDLPEARFELDDSGKPVSIQNREMGRSESLIEEFMIYCNEAVAGYLTKKKLPCIYRVHSVPTEEKLALLRETLTLMGIKAVSEMKNMKAMHLKILLEKTKGEKAERLVRYLVLRSLPQAIYSAANEGHFGLASDYYCHFTSPIRRYPDLVVHRIIKQHLSPGGIPQEKVKKLRAKLPDTATHASEMERAAVEAERASSDMKKAEYMLDKVGEVFTGIINGVTNFGLFVELDNTVEGMIPISELDDDYYHYNEKAASLQGERTGKKYRLGDTIQVQVLRVNQEEGQIAFIPQEQEQ